MPAPHPSVPNTPADFARRAARRLGAVALLSSWLVACGAPAAQSTGAKVSTASAGAATAATPGASSAVATAARAVAAGTLPLDPRVRTGKLANGLTYYILPHKKPEKRALLWLAVNAGSVLEDDDQRGLAHFLEHMAFNGTQRYKKMAIVNFIERIGMRFGADLNAYTSFDQTVYQLQVPTDDAKLVSQGFTILSEWAHAIAFDPDEVEKERGVVLEEWRKGLGAQKRVLNKQLPVLLHGSRYAKRLPIGTPEIIKGAPRSALTRFYADWYRPDLMAVVVVGDIEPADIEARVKATFGPLKNPAKPRPRAVLTVPAHRETLVTTLTDPELERTTIQLVHKLPHRTMTTQADYARMLTERLYASMLNERFGELRQRPKAPFLGAFAGMARWVRTMDAFVLYAAVKGDQVDTGVRALATEVERVTRHGFTAGELARAKARLLRRLQRAAAERNKQNARSFASELLRYHFAGEAMPGTEREVALAEAILPKVQLSHVNGLAKGWLKAGSRVIAISGPKGAKVPDDKTLVALATPAADAKIAPWAEQKSDVKLLAKAPAAGKVVKTQTLAKLGVTVWTLSNGAKVVVKPTTFKDDEVLFRAFSKGGHSLVSEAELPSAEQAAAVVALGGVGSHSAVALGKVLAGKVAAVTPYIRELDEGLKGSASPQDLETLLQLAHLRFVAPRKDPEAFAAWKARQAEALKNRGRAPRRVFFDRFTTFVSQNHPRRQPPSAAQLAKVDLDKALTFYRQRFADAADFTFVFVGNVKPAALKPLVETYLGSLPGQPKAKREAFVDVGVKRVQKGTLTVRKGMEPAAFVLVYFTLPSAWSLDAEDDAAMLSAALRIRLREVLREEMSGVYGVSARSSVVRWPKGRATTYVAFGCAPDNVARLKDAALKVAAELQAKGVSAEILEKIRTTRKRQYEVKLKRNKHWLGQLKTHLWFGTDPARILDTKSRVDRVTSARIQATAKRYLTPKSFIFAQLLPEAGAPPAK